MKNNRTILLIGFLFGFISLSHGQGYLSAQGKAIVNENGDTVILRGMGLGGWMLQEGYMLQTSGFANAQYQIRNKIEQLIGTTDTELFYDAWLNNHVRKTDIDSLKAWGFNSVRLPMHYNLYTLPIQDEPILGENTWLSKGFELTDSLISWCKQNQMYVILDLHAAPGGQGADQGISDYDPTKPSLWESQANKDKTVALWKRLAERYVNEPWVGGYDLLNETNWGMNGNAPLRSLYGVITDSIRAVDNKHIIFIEGNWFANDFTGLTPPWDNNMVYSPHKYWSFNDQNSIQWVLDIRDTYDVPLYLGESGENSNTWFRDAIKLLENHGIGWAWWPMKKIEAIAGPLSVIKTPEYQILLDYWNGSGSTPNAFFARAALMEIADNLKIEKCIYQKDVIDAMIRQVAEDKSIPYKKHIIPGVIHAADFDMGKSGVAYFDLDLANYHVSNGSFTAWNNGWAYRNDGVDIEQTSDNVNSNGFNVGWIEEGEWMQYEVDVLEAGVYDIQMRVATAGFEGSFYLSADGSDISTTRYVPNTGGYQNWQSIVVSDVVLTPKDEKIRFHSVGNGYNLNSFEFIKTGPTTSVNTEFLSAYTQDPHTIQLNINKLLESPLPSSTSDFQIFINGIPATIISTELDTSNSKIIRFTVSEELLFSHVIRMTYSGTQIKAEDATQLTTFTQEDVQNTLPIIHAIPTRIQAEDFFFQAGVKLENTFDTGGGKNVGNIDIGDYMDYLINVPTAGSYEVTFRTAAQSETGALQLQKIDENGDVTVLQTTSFPPTGDWQSWTSTTSNVQLPAGQYVLRALVTQAQFNFNWFEFTALTSIQLENGVVSLNLYPNPASDVFSVEGILSIPQDMDIQILDLYGRSLLTASFRKALDFKHTFDLGAFPDGNYFMRIHLENGGIQTKKIIKFQR